MDVGFIGLGTIGTDMAGHLVRAGHAVTVYARGQGLAELRAAGAGESGDYADLAARCEIVILCVFDDAQLRDILFDGGLLAAMRPGSILVSHVTGSPRLREEAAAAAPGGVAFLDVAFSGSRRQSAEGTLTLVASGPAEALEHARRALASYADRIFHVGPAGAAQVVKLLNNLVLAANMRNAANALAAAGHYGLDPRETAGIIQACSGASFAMGLFADSPADAIMAQSRKYMDKDVRQAMEAAAEVGMDLSGFGETVDHFLVRDHG